MSKLDYLGTGRVYGDRGTRELVVDTDSIRRGEFGGDEEFSGRDDDWDDEDDEEFGEEVEGDDDDFGEEGDFGDEVEGDDEVGEEVEGEGDFGATRKRRKGKGKGHGRKRTSSRKWAQTLVNGVASVVFAGAGTSPFSMAIRLQHDFKAQDLKVTLATTAGTISGTVTSVFFGDRLIFSDPNGVDASLFGATAFTKDLVKGQNLGGGRDILVAGNLTASAAATATARAAFIGQKPAPKC
ncbi:hypothetical protein L6R50_09170 [Myxococcota bacterium]|nr:hypothetical protein [Myxococcota bacterium]